MDARVSPRTTRKECFNLTGVCSKARARVADAQAGRLSLVAPKRLDLGLDRALVDYAHPGVADVFVINRAAAARNAVGVGLGERWRRKNYDNIGAMASIVGNAIEGRAVAAITANQRFG